MPDLTQNLILSDDYELALAQIGDAVNEVEGSALRAYWDLGELMQQFMEASKTRKFGTKSIEQLAQALKAKGVLRENTNAVRYLFWSKKLRERLPREKIIVYVQRGLGITIVKDLISLPEALANEVEGKLFRADGAVPSTREVKELVEEARRLHNAKIVHPETAALPAPKGGSRTVEIVDSTGDEPWEAAPETPGNAPLATPAPTPRPEGPGKDKPTGEKSPKKSSLDTPGVDKPVSPFKALKAIDKAGVSIIANLGDAIIALGATNKTGFDSPKAQKNFDAQVMATKAVIKDLLAALPDFLPKLGEE